MVEVGGEGGRELELTSHSQFSNQVLYKYLDTRVWFHLFISNKKHLRIKLCNNDIG